MDMHHQQKVEHLIEELEQQGMGSYAVAPPLFRLLWTVGLEVPPPLFLGFFKLTLLIGSFFSVLWGVLWGVSMWLWVWQGEILASIAISMTVFAAALAGLPFGIVMAWYTRRSAAQLSLPPSWEDYPEV